MAENYFLKKEQCAFAFDKTTPPVLEVDSGATVTFETGDAAYERLSKGETVEAIGLENFNAVTGPVYVRGAEPGDSLKIEVLDVQVRRAWSVWLPGFGGLGKQTDSLRVKQIPLENNKAQISDRVSAPVQPMIGCIGLAPAEGKGSTFMPAYPWGGNMDLREMSPGATLYLPVQVPGALLATGDLHAAMGVAEPTWVSLEAAGQATLRISLEKGMKLNYPRLRVGTNTLCLGMGDTLEKAHQIALDEAFALLVDGQKLDPFEAYAYASARVDMRLGGPATSIVIAVVPDFEG
jgi:amidase